MSEKSQSNFIFSEVIGRRRAKDELSTYMRAQSH